MKKVISGILVAACLGLSFSTTCAAARQIQIDGVNIRTAAYPEVKNGHVMVPLRTISENLAATVQWSTYGVTLTNRNSTITLKPDSKVAQKNGKVISMDTSPYIKNNLIFVPLRFVSEAFGSKVNYDKVRVTIDSPSLRINGVPIKALQQEYHMTMGGIVQQIKGDAYNQAIYDIMLKYKGKEVAEPANYSWQYMIDTLGAYYKNSEYQFLDDKGDNQLRYDTYSLVGDFPQEMLKDYPPSLIYDANQDKWYLFSETANEAIRKLIYTANQNGFMRTISNTIL
ncbi:copper amine oxidase N-terminal domain-containing protein [Paenibacillus shenyangensis]|uniref:copper amine oxidase N-terminal domain-containing protein n=1 Tax=Paenibacillus sp. A9 TaxID=1284352 RepID=UPI000370A95E|nr:copper amine oxidase N-terminal domain-containing protein [Paenibacillus sp. A9]